jgi:hypothetical protein
MDEFAIEFRFCTTGSESLAGLPSTQINPSATIKIKTRLFSSTCYKSRPDGLQFLPPQRTIEGAFILYDNEALSVAM